jgi:hypothetical protein
MALMNSIVIDPVISHFLNWAVKRDQNGTKEKARENLCSKTQPFKPP